MTEDKESEIVTKHFGEIKEHDWEGIAAVTAITGSFATIITGILVVDKEVVGFVIQGGFATVMAALALYNKRKRKE